METLHIALPEDLENMQLPSPEMVNYWQLAENRIFYIDYEIDETILEIQKAIININIADKGIDPTERIPVKLLINSPGGYLSETMSLASTMVMSKTPIITVNMGIAYSGGGLLLMAGHRRYAMPYSKALIHSGSGGTYGTYEQTTEQQKTYKRQVDDMGQFILERTGMDEKIYKKNKSREWYLMPEEQVQHGVVHAIVTDLDEIF